MSSSGSHRLRNSLIVLVVLLALLVAADRIGLAVAENVAADRLQSSQGLPKKPDVSVAGFPFLTQVASGNYDDITVSTDGIPLGSGRLSLTSLRVVLHSVHVRNNFSTVHAATADATARVSLADLGRALGLDVTYTGKGRITAKKSVTVLGQTVSASVSSTPSLVDGALSFTSTTVAGASDLTQAVTSALSKVFDLTVPLDGIPFEVKVRSLDADASGLKLVLAGSDLTYSR